MKKTLSLALLVAVANSQAKVTDTTSAATLKQGNVIVKFSAEWCGPCKTSKQPFTNLSNDPEFANVQFIHVDIDQGKAVTDEYGVQGIPTFVYIRDGKEVTRHSGNMNTEDVKLNLRKSFGNGAKPPISQGANSAAETESALEKEDELKAEQPQATTASAYAQASWWDKIVKNVQDSFSWLKNKFSSLFSR